MPVARKHRCALSMVEARGAGPHPWAPTKKMKSGNATALLLKMPCGKPKPGSVTTLSEKKRKVPMTPSLGPVSEVKAEDYHHAPRKDRCWGLKTPSLGPVIRDGGKESAVTFPHGVGEATASAGSAHQSGQTQKERPGECRHASPWWPSPWPPQEGLPT
ncbi:hypothetical protein NDU88_005513 [Pleurodeles waltl]|uniref:Uncharacterized protein n=1 Tax=Pleurodeles waltl TaxID=8319 RepID=A0AAV7WYI5_PLEWA|nr:hypothetical protein NDU88_005513 [Pleurodeles waltl]